MSFFCLLQSWLWAIFSAPSALGPPCDVVAASWRCPASPPATAWLSPGKSSKSKEPSDPKIELSELAGLSAMRSSEPCHRCYAMLSASSISVWLHKAPETSHFLVDSFTDPHPGTIPLAPVGCNLRWWMYECRRTIRTLNWYMMNVVRSSKR